MGTKRELAQIVSEVIDAAQPGTLVDLFSGMCSVAEAVGPKRQIWTNDTQTFAFEVGSALFTSKDEPLRPTLVADNHFDDYVMHCNILSTMYKEALEIEDRLLRCRDFEAFSTEYSEFKHALSFASLNVSGRDWNLFSSLYADSFFGLRQSIEVDAIIKSIHKRKCCGLITRAKTQ